MVSFVDYHEAREFLQALAPYFKALMSLYFILFLKGFFSPSNKYLRKVFVFSLLTVAFFFGLLLWFHLKIYNVVYLSAGFLPAPLRLFPPFWIETEKLFFWLFLSQLASLPLFLSRKEGLIEVTKPVSLAFSIFFLVVTIFDPFTNPLPKLHEELSMLEKAANAGLSTTAVGYIINFFYRVKYFYHSTYMWIHPPLLFASYAFFVIAFPLHLKLLINKRFLFEDTIENNAYGLVALGYLFLTLGLLVGYPWALEAWKNEAWWWSPKINVSIMMWLFYTAYLHGRIYRGSKLASYSTYLGVLSFAFLIFTYMATYLLPGVHSYG